MRCLLQDWTCAMFILNILDTAVRGFRILGFGGFRLEDRVVRTAGLDQCDVHPEYHLKQPKSQILNVRTHDFFCGACCRLDWTSAMYILNNTDTTLLSGFFEVRTRNMCGIVVGLWSLVV